MISLIALIALLRSLFHALLPSRIPYRRHLRENRLSWNGRAPFCNRLRPSPSFILSLSLPRIIASLVRNFSLRDGELSVRQFGIHRGDPYKGERSWRESRNDLQQADARIRLSRFRKGEMAERDPFLATLLAQDPRVDTRQPRWTSAGLSLSLSLSIASAIKPPPSSSFSGGIMRP